MPYTLTEEEKRNFTERYLRNVERINKYLPDNLKVSLDTKEITRRLNDPKEQRLYKRALELNEREERRQDLYDQLADENRYLREKGKTYALDRAIQYQFDMSNDPNARAYNENVIRNYYLHPEAMVQQEFKKVLTFNPTIVSQIAKSSDTENLLVDFYDKNTELCEYAYALKGSIAAFNKEVVVDELNENIASTASCYEMLKTASEMVQTVSENSFFVMPRLTKEQALYLENTNIDLDSPEFYADVKKQIMCNTFRDESVKEFKTFFKNLDKDGYNIKKKGGFNTLIAVKDDGGQLKKVPFTLAYLGNSLYADAKLVQIPSSATASVQNVFKKDFIGEQNFVQHDFVQAHENHYNTKIEAFKFEYAANLNVPLHKLDRMNLKEIVARHQGGFFENLFGTTSKEFKDVMAQIDNFYDDNSEECHDTDALARVGQAYLTYKGVKTFEDIMRLTGTSRRRALLCYSLVKTCKHKEYNMNFARDDVRVPERPIGDENSDLQSGQPAIVDIAVKEQAIPDKSILEDNSADRVEFEQSDAVSAPVKKYNSDDMTLEEVLDHAE